jgi:hypothetical protein
MGGIIGGGIIGGIIGGGIIIERKSLPFLLISESFIFINKN